MRQITDMEMGILSRSWIQAADRGTARESRQETRTWTWMLLHDTIKLVHLTNHWEGIGPVR